MKLFEIPSAMEELIDQETGELTDEEQYLALAERLENGKEYIALQIKNLESDAEALAVQKDIFAKREKVARNAASRLKGYLSMLLDGATLKTDKVSVGWRKSKKVVLDDNFIYWAIENGETDFLREKQPEVNKTAVKEALEQGKELPYASLEETQNIQIR